MPRPPREYDSIPGTYVFDGERSRQGYALNMFCMSLNRPENRDAFAADPDGYLDGFALTAEQRRAVVERDWLGLLKLGGNIYYTAKLAGFDGLTFAEVAAAMSGMTTEAYTQMMVDGGRSIEGNRSTAETTGH